MIETIRCEKKDKYWNLTVTMLFCVLSAVVYANCPSEIVSTLVGIITTCVICYKLITYDFTLGYCLLFGTQFLRAVIRISFGGGNYSFLLLAFPIFFIKQLYCSNGKANKCILIPVLLSIWDVVVSFFNSTLVIGDQILWGCAFIVLVDRIYKNDDININRIIEIFGLAIWGICLVNIFAEIRLFGQSLVPTMYGAWNSAGEYYTFGKGYVDVAGGNEIAQYIPLFIAMAIFTYKNQTTFGKVYYLVSIAFFSYCGMMCIARAFYVEILILAVFCLISLSKKPIKMASTVLVITISGIAFFKYKADTLQPVFNAVMTRFDSGYGSRAQLLENTINIWKSSFSNCMFGIGTEYNTIYETAHNLVVDSLISLGILGSILYLLTLLMCFIKACKMKLVGGVVAFAPITMLVIYKMISGCVKDIPFYFVLGICLLFIKEYHQVKYQSKENK